jgi:hypothetical protein
VFNLSASRFQSGNLDCPGVENININFFSLAQGIDLIKPFSLKEVKQAISQCHNYKTSGPNGVNFGFIKEFREGFKNLFYALHFRVSLKW